VSEPWNAGIQVAALSDVGMRRANNQDAYATLPADNAERYARRGHLFVVADGMGAHNAGELASQMAAEKISQYYLKQSQLDAVSALRTAVQEANADIHRRGQENPEFNNMGTTASSIAIGPQGVVVAHVGDSRVYRVRDGKLEQLTFDHSLVWEMQASGQIHPNSAIRHNIPKNVITRSLGPSEEVCVDIEGPFPVKKGDAYLLCSDGLTGQVPDDEIGPLIDSLPPDQAARVLVDLANLRGGPDNTTMIIVKVNELPNGDPKASVKASISNNESSIPWLLVGTAAFCVIGAGLLGFFEKYGPMVVAGLLGLIAAGVGLFQFQSLSKRSLNGPLEKKTLRSAPYRTYSAKPTDDLLRRLSGVLDALRQASVERRWVVDWTAIDSLIDQASQAKDQKDLKAATARHAEAIIQTMAQLRNQHRRPPGADEDRESVLK
jgi:serine/threonine protein phosphatase PrpC